MTKETLTSTTEQGSGTLTALGRVGSWIGERVQAVGTFLDEQARAGLDDGFIPRAETIHSQGWGDRHPQTTEDVYLALGAMYVVPTEA